ncbi:MAG: pantetheine-phosphate adenylyltransferase [Clostridia bacterium]|nr:pantetheine-phosphate adenylyltransferase [Clostridia bacterium]
MRTAVYPGSFDPITMGHIDIIKRASVMFDKLIICVMSNAKKTPVFTPDERVELIKRATAGIENIEVTSYGGLLADFARQQGAGFIVRGLRALSDFEYEFQMALTNRKLYPDADTVFLTTSAEYMYLSSSIVKEVIRNGGFVRDALPEQIADDVVKKIRA